jgi:hypothetical protein
MAGASRHLHMLLEPFKFRMAEEQQIQVLTKTKDLWNMKAKREGREVDYNHKSRPTLTISNFNVACTGL